MAKRKVKWKTGDVVSIPLSNGERALAWLLRSPRMAFYDARAPSFSPEEVATAPIVFSIWVRKNTVTDGLWPVIGHVEVPDILLEHQKSFKQDPITGALSIYLDGGEEHPASLEECSALECAAVWEPEHVVERLQDQFAGRSNKWAESMRPKAPKTR